MPEKPAWRRLFDLQRDPGETVDLLATAGAAHEALAAKMDSALRAHLVSRRPETNTEQLSPELIERLRSLGYVN